jgi:two-component system, NtrC family, sensor kinase
MIVGKQRISCIFSIFNIHMKSSALICLLLLFFSFSYSQNDKIDSLNGLIAKAISDTQRINLTITKLTMLGNVNLDSAIALAIKTIEEARNINYKKGEAILRIKLAGDYCFTGKYPAAKENLDIAKQILLDIKDSAELGRLYDVYGFMSSMQNKFDSGHLFFDKAIAAATLSNDKAMLSTILQNDAIAYQQQSNYPQALAYYQKALKISEQLNDEEEEAYICLNIGITYNTLDDTVRAEQSYFKAISFAKKFNLKNVLAYTYSNLSALYEEMKRFKEQYDFGMEAATLGKQIGDEGIEASSLSRAALGLANQNRFEEAETLNMQSLIIADSSKQPYNIYQAYSSMGNILYMEKEYSKAIPYFEKAFHSLTDADIYDKEVGDSYADLSACYEKTGNYDKALANYKISSKIEDSIKGRENIKKSTELTMNYEFDKKQQVEKSEQQKKNDLARTKQTALLIGLILSFILAVVAFNGFKNKRKAHLKLQQQNEKIESTLTELRSTQAQLIQAEKMASLGELTAGIAHEIQNPLNFVNNFSEVSSELLDEMNEELNKGDIEEVKSISNDIKQNLGKINHHGKRADAIVKSMLQHSRQTKGIKELTDINALSNEYLLLSYHGLRAKDKDFNAGLKTDFDSTIGKINIVSQDMGIVLLNLFNNAFYAVNEKKKNADENYKPLVAIQTKKINNNIQIKVTDNGNGIPQNIIDKIFQPFFTTKPTGQGTGLGLSLAYDIITKEHNGTINVESRPAGQAGKEGGTTFIIQLPANL